MLKACRKDEFPAHYPQGGVFPPLCPEGFFCPDEADACQAQLPVGSDCQLNRDGTHSLQRTLPRC